MQPFIYFFNEQRSHLTNEEYGDPLVVGVVQLLSVVVPLATVTLGRFFVLSETLYICKKLDDYTLIQKKDFVFVFYLKISRNLEG